MAAEHEKWLAQALEFARVKRYDDARELALRVIREDGTSTKALWIVAHVTDSVPERRNALKALLRLQPDNLAARQTLDAIERQYASLKGTTGMLSPIKPLGETPPSPPNQRGT
ncbi:MAG: hypothetical protein ABI835_13940, partial [Chloroflexota bacterium]